MFLSDRDGPATAAEADEALDTIAEAAETETTPEVAPEAGSAKPAAESQSEVPTSQPRDDAGRFTKPSQAPAETSQPEAVPATEVPVESTAPEEFPEFSYRADRQDFAIPGSRVGSDGMFIPTEQIPILQQLLAAGKTHQGSFQQRLTESDRRVQAAEHERDSAKAMSNAIVAKIQDMISRNEFGAWVENQAQNWPVLLAQAQAESYRVMAQQGQQLLVAQQQERQKQELEPRFSEALEQTILHYGVGSGLTDKQMEALYERLNAPSLRNSLFQQAPYDDPNGQFRRGEWVIDQDVVQGWVQYAKQSGPNQTAKIEAAAKQNAAKAAATANPPVIGAKGTGSPAGKVQPKKQFKNAKEADRAIFDQRGFENYEVPEE